MPTIWSKGKKMVSKAKTRAVLWSEATARELADNRTFVCPTCAHAVTRVRNLRYHMCEMHNLWCEALHQTSSFPRTDSVFRTPTAEEYKVFGYSKPLPAPKKAKKHEPNRVVYEDIIIRGRRCSRWSQRRCRQYWPSPQWSSSFSNTIAILFRRRLRHANYHRWGRRAWRWGWTPRTWFSLQRRATFTHFYSDRPLIRLLRLSTQQNRALRASCTSTVSGSNTAARPVQSPS